MSLQFENLVLSNLNLVCQYLDLPLEDIQRSGPFFQKATARRKRCQIDVLLQTYDRVLYLVEIKFSKHPIGCGIKQEIEEKIHRLHLPRGFSVKPILIHVNGVTENLEDERFFNRIINFTELLKG